MSIGAVIARPLFNDNIAGGLASIDTEIRITLQERWNNNTAWSSETGIEYAVWADDLLGSIGDPPIQGNAESTDGSGEIVINTAGFFSVSDNVLVALHKPGAGPSGEDVYGFGQETVTAV